MRYGNWDILLFPSGARIPIQEFGVNCFHCFDPELRLTPNAATAEVLRNATVNGSTTNIDVQYLTRTVPTVTAFITALPSQTPFHISLHCWNAHQERGTRMERISSSHGHMLGDDLDNRQYEVRVFIDDVLTTVLYVPVETALWPTIIDSQPNDMEGTRSSLLFPEFRSEYMEREWSGISGTGRINVVLSEGVTVAPQPYKRMKNLVAFSFVYAPNDVLEWAGISYPRSTFGSSHSPDATLPSLAHYLRRINGPNSRSTMERPFPISVFADRTGEIVNNAAARISSPSTTNLPTTAEERPALNRPPSVDEFGGGIAIRRGLSLRMRIARPTLQRSLTEGGDGNPFMGARRNISNLHTVSGNNTPNNANESIAMLRAEFEPLQAENQLLSNHLEAVTGTRWSPGNFDAIPVPPPPVPARPTRNTRPSLTSRNTMPNIRSPTIPELGREESPTTRRERTLPRFMQSPSSLGIETPSGELGSRDPFEEFIDFSALASSPIAQAGIINAFPFPLPRGSRLRSESIGQSRENSRLGVNENIAPSPSGSVLGSLGGSVVGTPQPIPEGQRQLGEGFEQAEPLEGAVSPGSEQENETPRLTHANLAHGSP